MCGHSSEYTRIEFGVVARTREFIEALAPTLKRVAECLITPSKTEGLATVRGEGLEIGPSDESQPSA